MILAAKLDIMPPIFIRVYGGEPEGATRSDMDSAVCFWRSMELR